MPVARVPAPVAHALAVRPSSEPGTWTVIGGDFGTVVPVEEWLEAHRHLWSGSGLPGPSGKDAQHIAAVGHADLQADGNMSAES